MDNSSNLPELAPNSDPQHVQPGLQVVRGPTYVGRGGAHSYYDSSSTPDSATKQDYASAPQQQKTIVGLRRPTFVLSVLLFLVVVAAAVGGGITANELQVLRKESGARSLQCSAAATTVTAAKPSSTPPTPTATTSSPASVETNALFNVTSTYTSSDEGITVPTTGHIAFDCAHHLSTANSNREVVSIQSRDGFTSWAFNLTCGADIRGPDIDMGALTAYSLPDCLRACAFVNLYGVSSNATCAGVFFEGDLDLQLPKRSANCFLEAYVEGAVQSFYDLSRWSAAGVLVEGPV